MNCVNCGYVWNYKGLNNFYVQCPMCRKIQKILKEQ